MNQFSVTLILIGLILLAILLILAIFFIKKAFIFSKHYEEKKNKLVEIINDAELMIEELNKFSDYVVTQMDFKNEELSINLKKAHEEIEGLAQKTQNVVNLASEANKMRKNEMSEDMKRGIIGQNTEMAVNESSINNVIPINSKYSEVLRLSKSGISEVEIAKRLNIGKGEIQLILELNKQ